jgi:hypothetical protein
MAEILIVLLGLGTYYVLKNSVKLGKVLTNIKRHIAYPYGQLGSRSMIPLTEERNLGDKEFHGLGTNALPVYYTKGPGGTKYQHRR